MTKLQVFATPETLIGFHPDAGASFYLSHLPGHLGKTCYFIFCSSNNVQLSLLNNVCRFTNHFLFSYYVYFKKGHHLMPNGGILSSKWKWRWSCSNSNIIYNSQLINNINWFGDYMGLHRRYAQPSGSTFWLDVWKRTLFAPFHFYDSNMWYLFLLCRGIFGFNWRKT